MVYTKTYTFLPIFTHNIWFHLFTMVPRNGRLGSRLYLDDPDDLSRGTTINRTYGTHKKLSIFLFLLTVFGPINYGPPVIIDDPLQ